MGISGARHARPRTVQIRTVDLMASEVEGQLVVLDLRSSAYLRINRSGPRPRSLLERSCDEGDLVAELVRVYGVGAERAATDVSSFVTTLERLALVER